MLVVVPFVLGFLVYSAVASATTKQSLGVGVCKDGKVVCAASCREGYKSIGGICYQTCKGGKDVGLLCREGCRDGYKDVSGVCWFDKCPQGQTKAGARCYEACPSDSKAVGCCLCRKKCRSGYKEVLGVCWKGLKSYIPATSTRKSEDKLLSYVPKTSAKKSYIPSFGFHWGLWLFVSSIILGIIAGGLLKVKLLFLSRSA